MNIQFVCILVTACHGVHSIYQQPRESDITPAHPSQVRSVYELLHKTTDNICIENIDQQHIIYTCMK